MSSSLNSRAGKSPVLEPRGRQGARARRTVVHMLLTAPFIALPALALARQEQDPLAGLRRWGSGQFHRFGFLVYEATLWAGNDPMRPPVALRLDYRRAISGRAITEASVTEMRRLGANAAQLGRWEEQMARLFPDVKPGDYILGLYRPEGASFIHNGKLLGTVDDAEFARGFFAIWLDPRSSAPELRASLLGLQRQ